MAAGIKVWTAAGALMVDPTSSVMRMLGVATVNTSSSLTDAGFATGTPWWVVVGNLLSVGFDSPTVTMSSNTMSWSFPGAGPYNTFNIFYGIK